MSSLHLKGSALSIGVLIQISIDDHNLDNESYVTKHDLLKLAFGQR